MNKFKDITGQRFGKLVTIEVERIDNRTKWRCICDCGNEKTVLLDSLMRGKSVSCGCFRKEATRMKFKTHGETGDRLYQAWINMRSRCNNPNTNSFMRYGGRGIIVCKEWDDYQKFCDWSKDNGYENELTIDRIDNDGDYEPNNCRWSTRLEQMNNTSKNVFTEINGIVKTLSKHADTNDINYYTLHKRYQNGIRGNDLVDPLKSQKINVEFDGKIKSLKEWSRHFEISYNTLQYRFCKGVRGKELFAPVDPVMSANANKRKEVI